MARKLARWMKGLALVAGAFLSASSAQAGFTSIGKHPVGEAVQMDVLNHEYGSGWHAVGSDFYNGTMSAKRMDDFLVVPSVLNITTGNVGYSTDQMWSGNKFVVSAIAKFSGNSQSLSMMDSHGTTHSVMNVQGYGYDITPDSKTMDMNGDAFKWVRSGDSGTQTSLDSDNADNRDHLITYYVSGLPGATAPTWLMFFEDLNKRADMPKNRTYADFNDLVVSVRSVVTPVPLPPAGWAGLFTLTGLAIVRGRKLITSAMTA